MKSRPMRRSPIVHHKKKRGGRSEGYMLRTELLTIPAPPPPKVLWMEIGFLVYHILFSPPSHHLTHPASIAHVFTKGKRHQKPRQQISHNLRLSYSMADMADTHTIDLPKFCVECEDQEPAVQCLQCKEVFCRPCFEQQHHRGLK